MSDAQPWRTRVETFCDLSSWMADTEANVFMERVAGPCDVQAYAAVIEGYVYQYRVVTYHLCEAVSREGVAEEAKHRMFPDQQEASDG